MDKLDQFRISQQAKKPTRWRDQSSDFDKREGEFFHQNFRITLDKSQQGLGSSEPSLVGCENN